MSIPATFEALVIVVLILVPGFIFLSFSRRVLAHHPESVDIRYFLLVVSSGVVLHAVIWPIARSGTILRYYTDGQLGDHDWRAWVWFLGVVICWPVVASYIIKRLILNTPVDKFLSSQGIGYAQRMPSAWDFLLRGGPYFLRIHLHDGSLIAGIYGATSLASFSRKDTDLFLEQAWTLDTAGNFVQPVPDGAGIWIAKDEIAYIEALVAEVAHESTYAKGPHE